MTYGPSVTLLIQKNSLIIFLLLIIEVIKARNENVMCGCNTLEEKLMKSLISIYNSVELALF